MEGQGTTCGSPGTWSGQVLVFDVPAKGPNIVLCEELNVHQAPVTDIAAEPAQGQVTAPSQSRLCFHLLADSGAEQGPLFPGCSTHRPARKAELLPSAVGVTQGRGLMLLRHCPALPAVWASQTQSEPLQEASPSPSSPWKAAPCLAG